MATLVVSTDNLALTPIDLQLGSPSQTMGHNTSTSISSSISMHTFGSQPSLRSSLRSSDQSSLRSFKVVRFDETQERRIIIPENDAPTSALPQAAHLPIDGRLLRTTRKFRSIPNLRLPLQETSNKQATAMTPACVEGTDFEVWLSRMDTLQKRPLSSSRIESKDSDRTNQLSRTKSSTGVEKEKEKRRKGRSWINLLSKV